MMTTIPRFQINEEVETKIAFNSRGQKRGGNEIWIDAEITEYNVSDDSYNILVSRAREYKVNPRAVHVPPSFLRKVIKDEEMQALLEMGYDEDLAMEALQLCQGNLGLAVSCLIDQTGVLPRGQERKVSSVFAQANQPYNVGYPPLPLLEVNNSGRFETMPGGRPKANEFDFDVEIQDSSELGFKLCEPRTKKNAIVGKRTSLFAMEHILQGSLLLAIGDTWVVGTAYKEIMTILHRHMTGEPVTLRFRGKEWMKEEFKERGNLKLLIVGAHELKKNATHVTVRVNEALLSTDRVSKSKNPEFNEVMEWRSYRPENKKYAVVRVWQYNRITKNVCVGRGKLTLPTELNKPVSETLEIKDDSGNITGFLMVKSLVARRRRR